MTLREWLQKNDKPIRIGCKDGNRFIYGGESKNLAEEVAAEIDEKLKKQKKNRVKEEEKQKKEKAEEEKTEEEKAEGEHEEKPAEYIPILDREVVEEYESICGDTDIILIAGFGLGELDSVNPMRPLPDNIPEEAMLDLLGAMMREHTNMLTKQLIQLRQLKAEINRTVKSVRNTAASMGFMDDEESRVDSVGIVRICEASAKERYRRMKHGKKRNDTEES